jgi:hypothetical protein
MNETQDTSGSEGERTTAYTHTQDTLGIVVEDAEGDTPDEILRLRRQLREREEEVTILKLGTGEKLNLGARHRSPESVRS